MAKGTITRQAAIDRIAANPDAELGLSATRTRGGVRTYAGGRGVVPADGGTMSRPSPVPAPRSQAGGEATVSDATYGVSGTPITSGFLRVLEEANQWLYGRNGVRTYYEMTVGDAQVYAVAKAVKLPVLSAKWEIVEGAGPGTAKQTASTGAGKQTAAKAQAVIDFVKENLFGGLEFKTADGAYNTQTWSSVVDNALDMIVYGCAVHEDVYRIDGDAIRLRKLAARLPITFYRWITDADGETLTALEQYGYRRDQFLNVPLPAWKMCRFTYNQKGANFWGIPLTRAMYPHWRFKKDMYRLDAIRCERNSLGVPTWRLAPGFSKEDKAAAYSFASQLASHNATCAVEPPGDEHTGLHIKGVEGGSRATVDLLPSIEHHNTMIAKAALFMFGELGQSGKGGSRALGESQGKFFQLAEQALADQIAETITATTIRRLVYLNFGEDSPVPKLVAANVQARALEDLVDMLDNFAQHGLVTSTQELRDELMAMAGLPKETRNGIITTFRGEVIDAEKGDKAIGAEKPPAPGQGPGAGGQGSGKQQASAVDPSLVTCHSSLVAKRQRTEVSPYWHEPVASTETHVDWRELNAHRDRTAHALRAVLGTAKIAVVQSVAKQVTAGTGKGKLPSEIALQHHQSLDDSVTPILQQAYQTARGHVRQEIDRLHVARHGAVPAIRTLPRAPSQAVILSAAKNPRSPEIQRSFAAAAQDDIAGKGGKSPALIADGLVQKLVNHYGVSARSLAIDGKSEDEIAAGLNDLSDGYLDVLADQGAQQAGALGRFDELADTDAEIQANGGRYERSEILDANTCGPCAAGDGKDWDSFDEIDWEPGDDCEGGDNCRGTVIAVFG